MGYYSDIPGYEKYHSRFIKDAYVTVLAEFDNRDMNYLDEILRKVDIIGNRAFRRSRVRVIHLPSNIKEVREQAFTQCEDLEEIIFDCEIKELGYDACSFCPNLKTVRLPNGLKVIGRQAFMRTAIQSIYIPHSVKIIGEFAFADTKLTSVHTNNAEIIGRYAFSQCENLRDVQFGRNLKTIEDLAFACTGLRRMEIPETVKNIGFAICNGCLALDEVIVHTNKRNVFDNIGVEKNKIKIVPTKTDEDVWGFNAW